MMEAVAGGRCKQEAGVLHGSAVQQTASHWIELSAPLPSIEWHRTAIISRSNFFPTPSQENKGVSSSTLRLCVTKHRPGPILKLQAN